MSDMTTKKIDGVNPEDRYKDEPVSGVEAEELLSAARLSLIINHPFFGRIALGMAFVETERIPTTAVDARGTFYYNRKWVNSFDTDDAKFELAHEVIHLVQRLFGRMPKGVHHGLWNISADYLDDTSLIDMGMTQSSISKEMVTKEKQDLARKYDTMPALYRYLLQEAENNTDCKACKEALKELQDMQKGQKASEQKENKEINKGEGESSSEGSGDEPGDGEGESHDHGGDGEPLEHTCGNVRHCCAGMSTDVSNMDSMDEQKWIEKVVAAKIHAESKGNMPAALGDSISLLMKSKVRWQDHLKAAATRLFGRDRYTYKRTNRRGPAMGLRLPGHTPDGKTAIGAVDTSASMSQEEVVQCISEFAEIMRLCGCSKLWLILHDTRVYFSGWVEEADLMNLKMARGGTSHREVFDCINKEHSNTMFNLPKEEEPTLVILFTDLGTDFPDEIPKYDVIWGVPSDGCPGMETPVPFGKKVEVDMS